MEHESEENETEWAEDIAERLANEAVKSGSRGGVVVDCVMIAAALRKAKADGYRLGADEVTEFPTSHGTAWVNARATEIEKGNA